MRSTEQVSRQYQLLTDWYISVLEGIKDEDAGKTIAPNTNSLEWIAGHLVVGRYRNMLRVGLQVEPYAHLDKFIDQTIPPPNAIAFSKSIQYPTLNACIQVWKNYSELFLQRLKTMDDAALKTEIPFTVLTGGNTVEDALTFMSMHEAFHIGQMSIMRKTLGYPAMQLARRK